MLENSGENLICCWNKLKFQTGCEHQDVLTLDLYGWERKKEQGRRECTEFLRDLFTRFIHTDRNPETSFENYFILSSWQLLLP